MARSMRANASADRPRKPGSPRHEFDEPRTFLGARRTASRPAREVPRHHHRTKPASTTAPHRRCRRQARAEPTRPRSPHRLLAEAHPGVPLLIAPCRGQRRAHRSVRFRPLCREGRCPTDFHPVAWRIDGIAREERDQHEIFDRLAARSFDLRLAQRRLMAPTTLAVTLSCRSKTRQPPSNLSAHRWAPVAASISWPVMRNRLPDLRTPPSST